MIKDSFDLSLYKDKDTKGLKDEDTIFRIEKPLAFRNLVVNLVELNLIVI